MGFLETWKNPSGENRIKPFWFWNGKIERDEIDFQLAEMKKQGVGGAFICPRQGQKIPYLGEEWFELVRHACRRGAQLGLEIWLYDEYPYPSGMAGGETLLEHPEAAQKQLVFWGSWERGGRWLELTLGWGKILYAGAVPVDSEGRLLRENTLDMRRHIGIVQTQQICMHAGMTPYTDKRFFTYGPQKTLRVWLPEGSWRLEIFSEEGLEDYKYFGNFFDPCDSSAVQTFLRCTHERYFQALGKDFNTQVKGIFSDEVFFLGKIPWSKHLPEKIREKHGYDLCAKLPALCDRAYPGAARIRYQLYQAAHELLRDSYHKQTADWCAAHGIAFVTETPSMRRSTQIYSTVPGGDACHEKLGVSLEEIYDKDLANYRSCAPGIASLAAQSGREYALVESFHSVGWTMTLQDAKWMIDYLAAMGINFYTFHAFCYTIGGLAKHDAPPSQFFQNPYWKHYHLLADYGARLSLFLKGTRKSCRIALLDPVTSLWTHLGSPRKGFSYAGEDSAEEKHLRQLREDWIYLAKTMLFAQIGFDFLDGEILCQAKVEAGRLYLGRAVYEVVVMPPMSNIERAVTEKLQEFADCGGRLVAAGMLPYEVIDEDEKAEEKYCRLFGTPDANQKRYWEDGEQDRGLQVFREKTNVFLASSGSLQQEGFQEKYLEALEKAAGAPVIGISVLEGEPRELCSCVREDEKGARYALLCNHGGGKMKVGLSLKTPAETVCRLDAEDGSILPVDSSEGREFEAALGPWESVLMGFDVPRDEGPWKREENCQEPKGKRKKEETILLPMDENTRWKISMEGENVFRLGEFQMSLDGKRWRRGETDTFIELCDRFQWLDGGQIRFTGTFGTPKRLRISYPVTLYCRREFQIDAKPSKLLLLMDREAITGEWEMKLNGILVEKEQFHPFFIYDRGNVACDVTNHVRTGHNLLELQIIVKEDWDGLREPLYLLGDFGVRQEKIVPKPEHAVWQSSHMEGFPWYSGTLCLETKLMLGEALKGDMVNMELAPGITASDCLELLVNGQSLGVRAFAPYRWQCPTGLLKEENVLLLQVTNTLGSMLEGS